MSAIAKNAGPLKRRPYLNSHVVRGLDLAFKNPGSVGLLFGVGSIDHVGPGFTKQDLDAVRSARRYAEKLAAWWKKRDERDRGEINDGLSAHKRQASIDREKADLLDEVMRAGPGLTPAQASKRWTAIEARRARALATKEATHA